MNVFFDTVGCRLNQSEIERMARQFRTAGYRIVANRAEADLIVVNTCAVTSQAASDSRQKLRQAAKMAPNARIIGTGCWSTLEPEETLSLAERVQVVTNEEKELLVAHFLGLKPEDMDRSLIEREVLPGARHRIRAFIKVQDGCDAHCTFCVTRIARGKSRSEPLERIIADIQSALEGGTQEIVLSGVQLGSWGRHLQSPANLAFLVRILLRETDIPRLRFSSIEPWDMDEDFFTLFSDRRICRHLHIALQSGSASTLKRMGRNLSPQEFKQKLDIAREIDPLFSITTDIITGFPGETESEFEESLQFIREAEFSGGHVFPYSARLGTPAAEMPGQVQSKIRKIRAAVVRDVLAESAARYRHQLIGQSGSVLWETSRTSDKSFVLEGFSTEYVRVTAFSTYERINVIDPVLFTGQTDTGLTAELLK